MYIHVCYILYVCMYIYIYICSSCAFARSDGKLVMETGWSPWEGHPYYSMATIRPSSDMKHLISS